jgi:hypothetical protein
MNIVMATKKITVIEMLIYHLIKMYFQYNRMMIRDQEIIHCQILVIIHTCVFAMINYPVDNDLKPKIFELLDVHIHTHGIEP